MVQSINDNSFERISGLRYSGEVRQLINPEVFKFHKVKFVSSFSQSLESLGISPVKQIVIP